MIYAEYDYYKTVYFGAVINDDVEYIRYATRAAADIDYYTMGKAKAMADSDAVKMAACAVAEQYKAIEASIDKAAVGGEIASESVGSYSRSFRSSAEFATQARAAVRDAINRYLAPTGLLYSGVSVCTHHML